LGFAGANGAGKEGDWRSYGGDPGGGRYSALAEIDRGNVGRLKRAWTYHTGDLDTSSSVQPPAFESTPLAVAGVLFVSTQSGGVIALDGDTGRVVWTFVPPPRHGRSKLPRDVHRGVSYWEAADGADRRIVPTGDLPRSRDHGDAPPGVSGPRSLGRRPRLRRAHGSARLAL